MAIFNSSDVAIKSGRTETNTTIITVGTKIKGEVNLECNFYIDGELEGSISSSKEVTIGKNGKIKGTIKSHRVIVQGYVEGSVDAHRVEIKAGGHISGEISSNDLVIESKGIFEGNSVIKDTQNKK
jgi:cytoskeletal protein CcmA (bactofilin family)